MGSYVPPYSPDFNPIEQALPVKASNEPWETRPADTLNAFAPPNGSSASRSSTYVSRTIEYVLIRYSDCRSLIDTLQKLFNAQGVTNFVENQMRSTNQTGFFLGFHRCDR